MHELSTDFYVGAAEAVVAATILEAAATILEAALTSDDYDPIQNFLWFLVDLSLVILHIATCLKKCGVFGESRNIGSDTGFDQAVCNAQLGLGFSQQVNISYGTLVNNATPNFETYEGDFDMIYNDRGTRRSGSVKIQLNSNGVDMKLMEALAMLMDALQ